MADAPGQKRKVELRVGKGHRAGLFVDGNFHKAHDGLIAGPQKPRVGLGLGVILAQVHVAAAVHPGGRVAVPDPDRVGGAHDRPLAVLPRGVGALQRLRVCVPAHGALRDLLGLFGPLFGFLRAGGGFRRCALRGLGVLRRALHGGQVVGNILDGRLVLLHDGAVGLGRLGGLCGVGRALAGCRRALGSVGHRLLHQRDVFQRLVQLGAGQLALVDLEGIRHRGPPFLRRSVRVLWLPPRVRC